MHCVKPGRTAVMAAVGHHSGPAGAGQESPAHPSMRGHLSKQARPHLVVGGLLLAAAAAQLATLLAGDAALVALTIAAVALVVTLVAAMTVRARRGSARSRRFLFGALAGIAWISWTVLCGISWTAVGVLMVVGYGLALPYWREHRIPNIPDPEPVEPQLVESVEATPQVWRSHLADAGDLAGTYLTDPQHTDGCGYEKWVVRLRPGKQTIETLRKNHGLIVSAFGMDPGDVVIEEYRHADTRKIDASRAVLTLMLRSPVQESVTFPGPQFRWDGRTGLIDLGPYADGHGNAVWRLFSKNSMWGGVVLGATGSGKSRLLEGMATSALSSGVVALVYADPQKGNSSPALADNAHWTARGVDQCIAMLRALQRIMAVRELVNQAAGRSGFTPTAEWPGILVILDECHMVLGDPTLPKAVREEAVWLAELISRVGRKLGVALVLASQEGDVKTFGGSNALRNNCRAGNTIVMRTLNKQLRGLLDLPFNPAALSEGGGYGYTMASPELGGRTAPFRGFYLDELEDDEYEQIRDQGAPGREGTSYWWLGRYPSAPFDDYTAQAAGEDYQRRHDHAAADRNRVAAALAAFVDGTLSIDELMGGKARRGAPAAPQIDSRATSATLTRDDGGPTPYGKVIRLPVYGRTPAPAVTAAPAAKAAVAAPAPTVRDEVYRLLGEGLYAPKDLAEAIGCTRQSIHNALNELRDLGMAYAQRQGVWRRVS